MATQNKLREGVTFPSFEEADTFINKRSVDQMSPIITRSSFCGNDRGNGQIQYVCPHGNELPLFGMFMKKERIRPGKLRNWSQNNKAICLVLMCLEDIRMSGRCQKMTSDLTMN